MSAQTDTTLTDKAEAICTTLEQANCILGMLADKYIQTMDYPALMAVDELLGKAKRQTNELITCLPDSTARSATTKTIRPNGLMESICNIRALGKTISAWAADQPVTAYGCNDVDVGDVLMIADMVVREANQLLDQVDVPGLRLMVEQGGAA